jgi:hypothetical protein
MDDPKLSRTRFPKNRDFSVFAHCKFRFPAWWMLLGGTVKRPTLPDWFFIHVLPQKPTTCHDISGHLLSR